MMNAMLLMLSFIKQSIGWRVLFKMTSKQVFVLPSSGILTMQVNLRVGEQTEIGGTDWGWVREVVVFGKSGQVAQGSSSAGRCFRAKYRYVNNLHFQEMSAI